MLDDLCAIYLFLYVKDISTSRRFYEETLGLPILELEDRAVKYDAGEIILALNVARFWDPLCILLEQMEKLDFIRANLPVTLLVAERVEDILPKLLAAARSVAEADKEMARIPAERM